MSKPFLMRMADGICKNGFFTESRRSSLPGPEVMFASQIKRYVCGNPRLIVDSVFDVYSQVSDAGGFWQHDRHAQRAIPPYKSMWAEYTFINPDNKLRFFYGCLIDTIEPHQQAEFGLKMTPSEIHSDCKWIIRYYVLSCTVNKAGAYRWSKFGEMYYFYNSIGAFLEIAHRLPETHEFHMDGLTAEDHFKWLAANTIPFSHAVSLINHKSFEARKIKAPSQVRKTIESRFGSPLLSYRTLWVDCFDKIKSQGMRACGDEEFHDARQHLVSGHFKYYTPEKPLFGRKGSHGWFWNDSFVRGNPELGTVVKDYSIATG